MTARVSMQNQHRNWQSEKNRVENRRKEKAMKICISHIYQDQNGHWVIQSNEDHTAGVAKLSSQFAAEFGMGVWGKVLGLLHDKGKESNAFQQHIKKGSGYAPETKVTGDYHHAYIGAVIARNLYGKSADNFFVNQILSHHSGLHDSDELDGENSELKKNLPAEVNTNAEKIVLDKLSFKCGASDIHHLSRMLYSCLVDADYLDTEAFMDNGSSKLRTNKTALKDLLPKLEVYLRNLNDKAENTEVNHIRSEVQLQCIQTAVSPIGFYSLTVPTGGGKTLSSLVWAMKHAIHNGQKRIIIAIPYTSIIVQTAAILREIFGSENVLEHHSNVDPEQIKDEKLREQMKLATENWDYPIVVTTNVQLFESMFSNMPSTCRKLHNIVNSVLILDEVQTLPVDYLQPIVDSLKTYNRLFKVSVLFTTASQPVLSGLIEGCNPKASFQGIKAIKEIIPEDFKLHERLRRVKLNIDNSGKSYDEVAEMLKQHKKVLCIVNTRKDAKELYERLPQEGITLHLSKMMCPAHISETIEQIRTALKDDNNEIIRVVSTQLIEAGVDIDFPVVFRQEAGLDSVLQAAGRCNREGKQDVCTTYVFSLAKEHNLPKGEIQDGNNARLSLDTSSDWFAPETMSNYFRQLYCRNDSFDKKDMKHYLYDVRNISFASAAKNFRLIEDTGKTVVVCWENSMELVHMLLQNGPSYLLMKKISKYCVNIYPRDFEALCKMGVVTEKREGLFVVDYAQQYDKYIGLRIDNNWANESLII